jgi:hypothetical protein
MNGRCSVGRRRHAGRVALDPCGGDGALRCGLMTFGVEVRLTDLYPEMYAAAADGYVASQPLDASDPEHLQCAFELAWRGLHRDHHQHAAQHG